MIKAKHPGLSNYVPVVGESKSIEPRIVARNPALAIIPPITETQPAPPAPPPIVPRNPMLAATVPQIADGMADAPIKAVNPALAGQVNAPPIISPAPIDGANYRAAQIYGIAPPAAGVEAPTPEDAAITFAPNAVAPPVVSTGAETAIKAKNPLIEATAVGLTPKPRTSADVAADINAWRNRKFDDKWNLLDTLKAAGIGALKGFAATGDIGGAIGAGAFGAIQGTVDPNTDEKFAAQNKIAQLQNEQSELREQEAFEQNAKMKEAQINDIPIKRQNDMEKFNIAQQNKFLLEQKRFESRKKLAEERQNFEGNTWERYEDENGKVWKKYKDGSKPLEAVLNPATGEQDVNPDKIFYETFSPITNTVVKVKGGTLLNSESNIEASQVGAANKSGDNKTEHSLKVSELKGKIASATSRVNAAKAKIARYETPQTKEDYEAKLKAETELTTAESDLADYQTQLKTLPPPQEVQGVTGRVVSQAELAEFAKFKGWTIQQAEAFAAKTGWTIN